MDQNNQSLSNNKEYHSKDNSSLIDSTSTSILSPKVQPTIQAQLNILQLLKQQNSQHTPVIKQQNFIPASIANKQPQYIKNSPNTISTLRKSPQQSSYLSNPESKKIISFNYENIKNKKSTLQELLDRSVSQDQLEQKQSNQNISQNLQLKNALFRLDNLPLNSQNKLKSQISQQSLLRYPKIFKQQPNNKWLFYLDHASKQGGSIRILDSNQEGTYNFGLKKSDKFLVYKIKTGKWTKYEELQRIFNNNFQSVSEYEFQQKWKQDGSNEHAFDFIKKPQNVKKLRKITLTGNRLSKKILSTDLFKLPAFAELELNFEENIPDQFLVQLMTLIAYKPLDFNFKVILWDSRKQEDFEDGDLSANIGNQIELKYRELKIKQFKSPLKKNQEKKAEQQPQQQVPRMQLKPGTYATGNTTTSGNITQYGDNVNGHSGNNVYHFQ